jgi:cystathionine beta-lyase/cystathionine gamma-synthase
MADRGPEGAGPRPLGEATRAVHPPPFPQPQQRPLAPPVYRTAAFAFADAAEYAELLAGTRAGYNYSRADNPTCDAFAAAVLALEAPEGTEGLAAQPFASGMAATAAVLMALGRSGGHVVAPREIYGGTYGLLTGLLARFGVEVDFVDGTDPQAVAAAIRPRATALVWAETLANPTMSVADLPALAAVAHQAGVPLAVDSTFASPSVCRPLEHGADLVVHSATKYMGGHADATGGVVVGRAELVERVRSVRLDLGSTLSPDEAFLLHRGLLTLPLRMQRHCASALTVAEALQDHPHVSRVDYPGLPGHRDHALARRLFTPGRFGAVVTVTPRRLDAAAGMALCDRLRLLLVATSLGGVHSKVSHVASTTHRQLPAELLTAAGVAPSAVRVSIGLEDPADLLADLGAALDAVAAG